MGPPSQALDEFSTPVHPSVAAHFGVLSVLLLLGLLSVPGFAAQNADNGLPVFFGTTNLWSAELSFSKEQWQELLQGKSIRRQSPLGGGTRSDPNYNYAHADFVVEGHRFHDVGVRLKGSGTQAGNGINRWPFRLVQDSALAGAAVEHSPDPARTADGSVVLGDRAPCPSVALIRIRTFMTSCAPRDRGGSSQREGEAQ